jgi:hypothetical protein
MRADITNPSFPALSSIQGWRSVDQVAPFTVGR